MRLGSCSYSRMTDQACLESCLETGKIYRGSRSPTLAVGNENIHLSLHFWPWKLYRFRTLKLRSGIYTYSNLAGCAALAINLKLQNSRILHTFMVGVTPLCKKKFRVQTRSSDYLCFHSFWIPCKSISSDKKNIYEYLKVLRILKCSLRPNYWGDCGWFSIQCFNSILACCESKNTYASLISVITWTQISVATYG